METNTILSIAAGLYLAIGLVLAFAVVLDMITSMSDKVDDATDGCAAILAMAVMFVLCVVFWIFLIPAVKLAARRKKDS